MPVSKLLKFPIGSYLMLRLDYFLICGDELEAKILRIIEMYIEDERRRLFQEYVNASKGSISPDQVIDITKEVWVSISHRLFLFDLYGLVKSENTLKRAINSLLAKKFISIQYDPKKKYESPRYCLNIVLIQEEFDKLAKTGKAGYQKLIPSTVDTIKNGYHQPLTPSGYQELTPSGGSRVSTVDTNSNMGYEKKDTEESVIPEIPQSDTSGFATATPPHDVDNPVDKSRDESRSSSQEPVTPDDFLPEDGTRATPASRSDVPFVDAEDTPPLQQNEPVPPEQPAAPTETPSEQQEPPKRRTPKKVPEGPPVLPPVDAPWPNAETAVQIVEARKKRRYGDSTRASEVSEAKKILALLKRNEIALTRERFTEVWDDMAAWPFWREHTSVKPMLQTLRRNDKILNILEELDAKPAKSNGKSPPPTNGHKPRRDELPVFDEAAYERLRQEAHVR